MSDAKGGVGSGRERVALALLLGLAALHGAWNAGSVPPLTGYDAPGHAAYVLTILREGRLPGPLEGWSTFHPPLYYGLGAGIWGALEPASGRVLVGALRALGVLAWLFAGLAAYLVVRRLDGRPSVALVATALALFLPSSQMAAVMVGNEALLAGLAAGALGLAVGLHEDPGRVRRALAVGLLAGAALATKYTGLWVALAAPVPLLAAWRDPGARRSLAAYALAVAVIAGPLYGRNLVSTGSVFPMTRELEPMRSVEALSVLRPRRAADYVWLDPRCLLHPSAFVLTGDPRRPAGIHAAMTNVWGVAYASTWWDAFGHRISPRLEAQSRGPAAALALLGGVPSLLALLGFGVALARTVRSRGRAAEAPLVIASVLGLASFAAFSVRAPGLSALKGSYLLPLVLPAAVFFARGLACLSPRLRAVGLGLSGAAALLAAVLFTNGLVFEPPSIAATRQTWLSYARQLPGAHIEEAVHALMDR